MPRPSKPHVLSLVRKALQMNQTDFSEVAGCPTATIQAIEQGKFKLGEELAAQISVGTGIEIEWLLANNLSAPIPLSFEAGNLHSPIVNGQPSSWSAKTYRLIEKRKGEKDTAAIYLEQAFGLQDYARLRAIIESARHHGAYPLARMRLNRFLEAMEREFMPRGIKFPFPKDVQAAGWSNINFIAAELDSAALQTKLFHDVVDPDDDAAWNELLAFMAKMRAASPYEDHSDPEAAARIKAAIEEALKPGDE